MRIERKKVADLFPAEYNPRKALKPGDGEYEKLANSIRAFGLVEPLVFNDRTGTLVGGHQRLTVLRDMGVEEVDVSVVDLDSEHEKALNLALNKIDGAWDNAKLSELLAGLATDLQDIAGFNEADIDALVKAKASKYDLGGGISNLESSAMSMPGDVWCLGPHRLMCGDSCSAESMAALMGGELAKLAVTDPPYNVNYGDKADMLNRYGEKAHRNNSWILNDNMDDASFSRFLHDAYSRMYENMEDGAPIYVFHAETEGINFRTAFLDAGFKLSQCLVWCKSSIVLGRNDYHWRHEPILYGWKEGAAHAWYGGRKKSSVINNGRIVSIQKERGGDILSFSDGFNHFVIRAKEYEIIDDGHDDTMSVIYFDKPQQSELHPTMKPVGLLSKLLRNSSCKGDLVLDPFGGSGSTLMACEEQGRVCRTMELSPEYCDVIVQRYADAVGKKQIYRVRDGEKVHISQIK